MMHTIKELYKINGEKFYTADYITAHNIPKATGYNEQGWSKCYGLGTDRGTKNIHTANGVKTVYTYGEKTWFDTAEERDAYLCFTQCSIGLIFKCSAVNGKLAGLWSYLDCG